MRTHRIAPLVLAALLDAVCDTYPHRVPVAGGLPPATRPRGTGGQRHHAGFPAEI